MHIIMYVYIWNKIELMFSKKVEEALNNQIKLEGYASHIYLSMAVWARVMDLKVLLILCTDILMRSVNIC